jgi:hypothetical protein
LQRTYGNQAVLSLLARQRSAPEPAALAAVQRQLDDEDDDAPLQRIAAQTDVEPEAEQDLGARLRAGTGSGSPLAGDVQRQLEAGLGADLSGVRVHTDGEADHLARSVSASAFTSGRDIYFRQGAYSPGSSDGLATLAHEATHVVQQAVGPVAGTPTGQGVSVSDPSDSFERTADATAARIASGGPAAEQPGETGALQRRVTSPARSASGQPVLQRYVLRGEWTHQKARLTARQLVRILNEEAIVYRQLVAINVAHDPFMEAIVEAHLQAETKKVPAPLPLGGTTLQIAPGKYINLQDTDYADQVYGGLYKQAKSVRGEGPNYAELGDALRHYVQQGRPLPKKSASISSDASTSDVKADDIKPLSDVQIAQQLRAVLADPAAPVHPVVAHLAAVLAGAEWLRNPRATVSLSIFLDLVESGVATFEEGLGPSVDEETESGGLKGEKSHLDILDRASFFDLPLPAIPDVPQEPQQPEGKKPSAAAAKKQAREFKQTWSVYEGALKRAKREAQATFDAWLKQLDLSNEWKKAFGSKASLRGFGGAIPMTGGETAAQGGAPIPADGEDVGLNLVQAKEATLLARWLDVQVARMDQQEIKVFEALLAQSPDAAVRNLIRGRLINPGSSLAFQYTPDSSGKGEIERVARRGAYTLSHHQQGALATSQLQDAPVRGDGDCFFNALIRAGVQGSVQQLRTRLADAVAQDATGARFPFIPDNARATVARSIRTMGDYANFAGDVTPQVAADVLGLTITIVGPTRTVPVGNGAIAVTLLRFTFPAEHYHATAPLPVAPPPVNAQQTGNAQQLVGAQQTADTTEKLVTS